MNDDGRTDHMVLWWLAILTVIVGIAFALTYQRVNNTVNENRTLIVQLQETNKKIVEVGNTAIVSGCKQRNSLRQGTIDFLDTFGDAARIVLLDVMATPDAKQRATATLVRVAQSKTNYVRKNKLEVCEGPLHQ